MTCGIYAIIHQESGRRYIGSSRNVEKRLMQHMRKLDAGKHQNVYLQNAYSKHGPLSFEGVILQECFEDILIEQEQVWIDRYRELDLLYNLNFKADRPPSWLGRKKSPASIEKTRVQLIGRKQPPNATAKMRATMAAKSIEEKKASSRKFQETMAAKSNEDKAAITEKWRATKAAGTPGEMLAKWRATIASRTQEKNDEIRERIRKGQIGKKQTPETVAKRKATIRANGGWVVSEETKRKIGEANRGRERSLDSIAKQRAAWAAKRQAKKE